MGNRFSRRPRPDLRGGFYGRNFFSRSPPSEDSDDSSGGAQSPPGEASPPSCRRRLGAPSRPRAAPNGFAGSKGFTPAVKAAPLTIHVSLVSRDYAKLKSPTRAEPAAARLRKLAQEAGLRRTTDASPTPKKQARPACETRDQAQPRCSVRPRSRSGSRTPHGKKFSEQFWEAHVRPVWRRLESYRCPREKFENFELLKFMNKGSFGSVYKVRLKRNKKIFAMKIQPKVLIVRKKLQKYACQEKRIFAALDFKFIAKLFFAFKDNANLYLVMELVENGDMSLVIKQERKLPEWRAKLYAAQLVLVLEYLHRAHILYRDLKPTNILIADDGYVKVIDFGVATEVHGSTHTLCGTPPYMAPEIFKRCQYGTAVDWWALGIVVYEMLHGQVPFKTPQNEGTVLERLILTAPVELAPGMSEEVEAFVSGLLERDVSRRLGSLHDRSDDIMRHSWFREISFEMLYDKKYQIPISKRYRDLEERGRFEKIRVEQKDHFPNDFLDF